MAEERTDRHALPLLQAGQAQKELTHNEALVRLDLLAAAAVVAIAAQPPAGPQPGQCWLVDADAGGEWASHAGAIAGWTASGWRFVAPSEGMRCWIAGEGVEALYRDGVWRIGGVTVLGEQAVPIADPTGGDNVDVQVREAVAAMLTALRGHGLIAP